MYLEFGQKTKTFQFSGFFPESEAVQAPQAQSSEKQLPVNR